MDEPVGRKSLSHEIPPNVVRNPEGEVFFITISCQQRGLNQLAHDDVWNSILETMLLRESKSEIGIRLVLAMPDHLHGLFSFDGAKTMENVISSFKSWIAKKHGVQWQRRFFDHRLRDWESGFQKGEYIRENPVRAGLVAKREDWAYVYDAITQTR